MAFAPKYRLIEGWEQCPEEYRHYDVSGVAVDSRDRVFVLTRHEARIIVYERDGSFVQSWGEDLLTRRTHGICIGSDDTLLVVDDSSHCVRKFAADGKLLMTLGTPGVPSDTGFDRAVGTSSIQAGPPFNLPTKAAFGPDGEIFVADGYGNARVHRFSAEGKLLQSWGEAGTGPGQFNVLHSIGVADGRVFVCDRENDRVQVFTPDGEFLEEWDHVQRPTDIYIDKEGLVYVSSLWWPANTKDLVMRPRKYDLPGTISVLDLKGNLLLRWCSADRSALGNFVAPHGICTDSRGDLYVGEVTWTFGTSRGHADVPQGSHDLQKFARE